MAIKPFNSIQGFSVGEIPANIILANGDITTTNITANGISNLGPVSNLILTGGSNGQVVTTDGSGNLTFTTLSTSSNLAAPMPYFIPTGESYTVSNNFQGLFSQPIEIDGVFEVIGSLIELGEPNESANTQVLFNDAGVTTGNTGFTFNKNNGNINITGNVIAGNTVSANFLIGDGGLLSNITAVSNLAVSQIQNGSSLISFTGTNGNAVIEVGGVPNILVASTGGITTTGIVVSGVSNLGDVANVKITGGSAGYTLTTDGTGNLSWDAGAGGAESSISNGTSNVNIGTSDGAVTVAVGGTSNIAVFSLSGLDMPGNVIASRLVSNVTTGVAPLVVSSTTQVANLNSATAGTVRTNAQPNITSVGTLTGLSIAGDLAVTGNLTAGNISGTIATAGTVSNAAQPNITSVGTLSNLAVSGNITAFDITAANNVTALTLTGSLSTGVQTNITQVGTLSVLAVTANISAGNINAGNLLGANYLAGTLITSTQPNITQLGTLANLTVNGNADVGIVNSGPMYANGVVNASRFVSNVATGLQPLIVSSTTKVANLYVEGADTASSVTSSSQPNITTVGTLTNLAVSGSAVISGDLYVDGNITYLNVSSIAVEDPLISVGNGPNSAPLSSNDGKDRGLVLNYYSTTPQTGFMGWDNSNAEFAFGSQVSISSEVVTYTQLGNIRAGNAVFSNNVTANFFTGDLYGTANLAVYATTANLVAGANVSGTVNNANIANTAGYVTNNTQSNITSVGTLTQLAVTGNISAGNINGGNLLVGNYVSGVLTTPNQTNVTSVGDLIYLTVSNSSGIVNFTNTQSVELGSAANLKITGGTNGYVLSASGNSGSLEWIPQSGGGGGASISNGTSNVAIATSNGNVTVGVAGNANVLIATGTGINVTGTLNATGNANVGNLGTARILATANITAPQLISNVSTGTAPLVVTSTTQVANLNSATAGTVTTAAQPNITSVGTLSSVAVTANANVGNLNSSGKIIGNDNLIVGSTGGEGGQLVIGYVGVNGITGQANGTWNIDVDSSNNFRIFTQYANGTSSNTTTIYTANNNVNFANGIIVNGTANLGAVGNITITGGTNGYVLSTNGSGGLTWVAQSGGGSGSPGGSNTQVQFNDAGLFGGNSQFTYDKTTNTLTAGIIVSTNNGNATNFKVGDDAWIGDINTADTVGIRGQQNAANAYIVFGNNDTTAKLGRAGSGPLTYTGAFTVSANITTPQFISNVATGTAPLVVTSTTQVANLNVATAGTATTAGTVTTAAQPNITSVGTLSSLAVTGNITSANVTTSAYLINGVTTGITAAGTVQSNATALTTSINIVTTTNSGTGVVLPTAVGGMMISVINAGGNTLAVYPAVNGVINSQSANIAYSLAAGGRLQFVAGNSTQWYTLSATYA